MKTATRVVAMIALSGGVAGAAVAIAQAPAPQTAAAVAVSEPGATDAVRQLADESARLHAAIASAETQLSELRATAVTPSASPDLAALLAQVQGQLADARQRMAVDEALLAKLRAAGQPQHSAAVPTTILSNRQPTPSETPSTSRTTQQPAAPTPTATPTSRQHTYSPSPRPTNRGGDD